MQNGTAGNNTGKCCLKHPKECKHYRARRKRENQLIQCAMRSFLQKSKQDSPVTVAFWLKPFLKLSLLKALAGIYRRNRSWLPEVFAPECRGRSWSFFHTYLRPRLDSLPYTFLIRTYKLPREGPQRECSVKIQLL